MRLSGTFATQRDVERVQSVNNTYEAVIKTEPADVDEQIRVTIPAIDPRALHGPCPWMPRVDDAGDTLLPVEGDRALVVISEDGDPWVIAWWPA